MEENIALLLQSHFIDYCRKNLGEEWQSCKLTYIQYENIGELQKVFLENKGQYSAFITSGTVPLSVLQKIDTPPYAQKYCFGICLENLYRGLLDRILRQGAIDPERIGVDYFENGDEFQTALKEDRIPEIFSEFEHRLAGMSVGELEIFEQGIVEKYLRQYQAGKLDFAITFFYSVVKALEQESVECCYCYPSRYFMTQKLELCLKDIRLKRVKQNGSAVIRIRFDLSRWSGRKDHNQELELLTVKRSLLEYCKMHHAEPIIKDDFTDLEVYVNAKHLQQMTQDFTSFNLLKYLEDTADFKGYIGIGTGENLNYARTHAMQALDYRVRLDSNVCVYVDETERVHSLTAGGHLRKPEIGVPMVYVDEIANRCHLSAETIYRVIRVLQVRQTSQLTSMDLIEEQNFSLRVATRVLKAMAEAGYAEVVGQKRAGNRGRPQNLYRIKIDGLNENQQP